VPSGTFFVLNSMNTIFAKKIKMGGKFLPNGDRVGITLLSVLPMKVAGMRTMEKHGYKAVQLEIADGKIKRTREVRMEEEGLETGSEIKFEEIIKPEDKINVSGIMKGKGFTGAVKRYHFKGGPRTHGQSDREKAPGSSGSTTTPGRVYKGKRRAGHMGNEKVTIRNIRVLEVDPQNRLIVVKGSVPGAATHHILTLKKIA
jgi:large subunit ribosomal protein L3